MEKICEFCTELRIVVYYKANTAHLCLSCDAKVHSANALSNRHFYMGCPSAKDFATMWGFELNEVNDNTHCDQLVSTSCGFEDSSVVDFDIPRQPFSQIGGPSVSSRVNCATAISNAGFEVGSSSQQSKEHLSSSSITSLALNGESFWQCKSPIQTSQNSSQQWSQNMQDLGVCEELLCDDDLNIPDVDLTFQGFEELFGGDEDPINALLYDNVSCSSIEKDVSYDTSDNFCYKTLTLLCSFSIMTRCLSRFFHLHHSLSSGGQRHSADCLHPIRSSYSTLSFSVSRCSAKSSGTDCLNSGVSPYIRGEPSHNSPNLEGAHLDAREIAKMRYKEKKKSRL
ncbi:hypothetical protein I3842_06G016100 [Carya illinoinensis]|uniref:Uncharacterized protein n=1 Tax=Carya illinoinensis TaxID=32201 RepID=A0A922JJZ3_CARIL|nr:hypothetical protein I3842_06G016100 [Carya illinoinensis]